MGSAASSFSALSRGLSNANNHFSVFGGRAAIGPLGTSNVNTKIRQTLDPAFGVPKGPGDSGYQAPPPDPTVTPVTPMPVPGQDDLASIAARRQSIQQQLARRGRVSTILSNAQNEPLGG